MIYLNLELTDDRRWHGEPKLDAGEIVRDFLTGERDLLELEHGTGPGVDALRCFLEAAEGRPIIVARSINHEMLIRAVGASDSLIVTGRTAEVVAGYLDNKIVSTEDRWDMTLRRRPRALQ
ncbi:MAG: hypothetical protein ACXVIJ_03620 [Thermoanaerobaculia bacterium]